jgi:NarL family two-component system sensor histidine kinase LiaS
VKEAVNNAAKYSGASELFLRIHRRGGAILVVVEDNGRGFDLHQVDTARNGLTNMSQRMEEISGKFRIMTRVGSGCRVEFEVPLVRSSRLFAALNVAPLPKSSGTSSPGQEAAVG